MWVGMGLEESCGGMGISGISIGVGSWRGCRGGKCGAGCLLLVLVVWFIMSNVSSKVHIHQGLGFLSYD